MKRWLRLIPIVLLGAGTLFMVARPGTSASMLQVLPQRPGPGGGGSAQLQRDDRLLSQILLEIYSAYYKPVDIHGVTVAGLKGMMSHLDPYSEFYVEEQDEGAVADLEITTTGTYSGVGATIGRQGDDVIIVAPMKGSPAERSGLLPGDAIVEIDGVPSRSFSTAKAASLIKGPSQSVVTLMIRREGIPEPLEFKITREQIEVNDVSASDFAAPGIAYIEIGRFTRNTGRFLVEAIHELEQRQQVEGIILDLRGNPGGLLDEALAVAEPFLPQDELVVFTRGRMRDMNMEFRTREPQVFRGRLVVLVNQASASASEIVAGTVQDLDRGVVIGETTIGKGLVQSVAAIPNTPGAIMRLTTGEYFTPSGRNLQRPFVRDAQGRMTIPHPDAPDTTEHPTFTSTGGREVTGGGGVVPDINIPGITGNILLFDLKFRRGMFLRYVNNYVNTRNLVEGSRVTIDDALVDDFRTWCLEQDFTFQTPTEMQLGDLKRTARAEEIDQALAREFEMLEQGIAREKERLWDQGRNQIRIELEREFITRLEGYEAGLLAYARHDPQFKEALAVIQTPQRYASILRGPIRGEQPPEASDWPRP